MRKQHKPSCLANLQCLVDHQGEPCPGPYGKCTCDIPTPPTSKDLDFVDPEGFKKANETLKSGYVGEYKAPTSQQAQALNQVGQDFGHAIERLGSDSQQGWEKEFDKRFEGYWRGQAIPDEIKFFIGRVRAETKEDFLKELMEKGLRIPTKLEDQRTDKWEKEFLKIHYEPVHESGGVCWCGVEYHKIKEGMEIKHKEQRDILKSFISSLLADQARELREKVEERLNKSSVKFETFTVKDGVFYFAIKNPPKEEMMFVDTKKFRDSLDQVLALLDPKKE